MTDAERTRIVALLDKIGWPESLRCFCGRIFLVIGNGEFGGMDEVYEAIIEHHLCEWLTAKSSWLSITRMDTWGVDWNGRSGTGKTLLLALVDACEKAAG